MMRSRVDRSAARVQKTDRLVYAARQGFKEHVIIAGPWRIATA